MSETYSSGLRNATCKVAGWLETLARDDWANKYPVNSQTEILVALNRLQEQIQTFKTVYGTKFEPAPEPQMVRCPDDCKGVQDISKCLSSDGTHDGYCIIKIVRNRKSDKPAASIENPRLPSMPCRIEGIDGIDECVMQEGQSCDDCALRVMHETAELIIAARQSLPSVEEMAELINKAPKDGYNYGLEIATAIHNLRKKE